MLPTTSLAQRLLQTAGIRPTYVVHFGDEPGEFALNPNHIASFLYGPEPREQFAFAATPLLVLDPPGGIGQELDLLTGKFVSESMTVRLEDHPTIRSFLAANRLFRKDMVVWAGFDHDDWAYTDWMPVFRGVISGWRWTDALEVSARHIDGTHPPSQAYANIYSATIPTSTAAVITADTVTGDDYFSSVTPPLSLIEDLIAIANFPARFIDATTLSPAAHDDLSHLRVSAFNYWLANRRIGNTQEIWDAISEVAFLCRAFIRFDETGTLKLQRVSTLTPAVMEFGPDELVDDCYVVEMSEAEVVTSIQINTSRITEIETWDHLSGIPSNDTEFAVKLQMDDHAKKLDWGYSGLEAVSQRLQVDDNWFGAIGAHCLFAADPPWTTACTTMDIFPFPQDPLSEGTALTLDAANGVGWPGVGALVNGISAERPVYLALVEPVIGAMAIMKYEGAATLTIPGSGFCADLHMTGGSFVGGDATLTAALPLQFMVFDITAPYLLGKHLLEIYSESASKISCRTRPHTYPVQVGDFVTLDTSRYVDFGLTGDPGPTKFIVLRKSVDPSDLSIEWILQRTNLQVPTIDVNDATAINDISIGTSGGWSGSRYQTVAGQTGLADAGFVQHVPSTAGLLGPTMPAALTHTIEAGFYVIEKWSAYSPQFDHTYTANKDTWCYVGGGARQCSVSPAWTFIEVAKGAARPATPAGAFTVMRVRTSGTAITEVLDFRNKGLVDKRSLAASEQLGTWRLESMHPSTIDGLDLSVTGGSLTETLSAGIVHSNGKRARRPQDEIVTLTASRIAFFDADEDGVLAVTEVALGSDEPLLATDSTRVGVAITNGAGVTNWFKFPMERPCSSMALNPQAVRDGFAPNGLLDDYDVDTGKPMGWDWTQGANAVLSVVTSAVKAGRYGVEANIKSTATQSDIWSDVFPIATLGTYTLDVIYSTTGYVRGPYANIGWEFFDRYGVSLGTRFLVLTVASGPIPVDVTNQGALLTGTWIGVGAGANQIPDLARYARWWIELTANVAGDAGVTLSMCMTKP